MREEYQRYTKPAELHKAVNTLRGIVAGITSDGIVSNSEIVELTNWCTIHSNLKDRHPFSELLPIIERSCEDGVIDEEDTKDILWLCNNFADNNSYYDAITSSIQFLNGLVHGMLADGELSDQEIKSLENWIYINKYLEGTYPFDEIASLLSNVLKDGIISQDEREVLLAFLGNCIEFKDSYNLCEFDFAKLREKYSIAGICATNPTVKFRNKTFCFTGQSYRTTRDGFVMAVREMGGTAVKSVSGKTDYLVVGNGGNPCWAYSCYGRKIEEAIELRKNGKKVIVVNEADFWNAVDNACDGVLV